MYETIKKFLDEGGKCLLIENGKPIGVVLTMEEYEKLKSPAFAEASADNQISNLPPAGDLPKGDKSQTEEKLLVPEINSEPVNSVNPIGAAMVEEMNFPSASANIDPDGTVGVDEINLADAGDVTLEDLGLDELP